MTDAEILSQALAAQAAGGPRATVEVLIERLPHPKARSVKQLRLRPRQGPRGRIVAITPEGTRVQYEACKLISYFSPASSNTANYFKRSRIGRVKINPWISEQLFKKIGEICATNNLTLSATVDHALHEYVQKNA